MFHNKKENGERKLQGMQKLLSSEVKKVLLLFSEVCSDYLSLHTTDYTQLAEDQWLRIHGREWT